jgi:hypothetical protein
VLAVAARVGIVAAVVGVLYVLRPGVVENGLRSPRVWVTVLLALVASRLVAFLVRRTTGRARTSAVAGNLVLAVIGVVLLAPSFQQRTVEEPFPTLEQVAATAPTPAAAPPDGPTPSAEVSTVPDPAASAAPAAPSAPGGSPAPAASVAAARPAPAPPSAAAITPPSAPAAPAAPEPRRVASGDLDGVGHSASGRVVLYAVGERLVVRFEDVDIEGTPGPYVHLVRAGGRTPEGGLDLGGLTAERGTFSYMLPPGVDASASWSVLVWCRPFATPVAAADLGPA